MQPELLLLDEPTNHLDIGAIERLEELLLKVPAAVVVTHDRAFLDRVTTRIVELDRGVLRSYPGEFCGVRGDDGSRSSRPRTLRIAEFDKFWAAGRGLDPQRGRGPPHPQRRTGAPAGAAARRASRPPRTPRRDEDEPGCGCALRSTRRGADGCRQKLCRTHADRAAFDADPARRSHRAHRYERRRQDHAHSSDPRRAAAG